MNINDIDKSKLKLVHTSKQVVRWRDLDDLGHVNNSVYFTYLEQARAEWWQSVGILLKPQGDGPVILTAECLFLKPIYHPAHLQIELYAGQPGTSSFLMYYEIFVAQESMDLAAKGVTKAVWVDYQKNKSTPLPAKIKKLISQA